MLTQLAFNDPKHLVESIKVVNAGLGFLYPEIALSIVACAVLLFDLITPKRSSGHLASWLSFLGLLVAMVCVVFKPGAEVAVHNKQLFHQLIAVDGFGDFFKLICLMATAACVLLTYYSQRFNGERMGEYYALLLSSAIGMCLMASATDFLTAFLGIEMVSIPSYVLVGYFRDDRIGTEASIKYLLYGAFSSGLMLFGVSILYGLTGSTNYAEVSSTLAEQPSAALLPLAITALLIFGGFAYKLAAAPFHFWAPDVYQGAPTPITAWLAIASKTAGIAAFTRFLFVYHETDGGFGSFDWSLTLAILAGITMTVGNVSALMQTNFKRLLAYSSIAHVGYLMMGLSALGGEAYTSADGQVLRLGLGGGSAAAFYAFAYLWMNLGAFAVFIAVSNRTRSDDIASFAGLGRRAPALAIALTICLFSLIGIPPTVGFTGKLQLFLAVIKQGGYILAVVAGVNTAISVYYYFRIIKTMFLEKFMDPASKEPFVASSSLTILAVLLAIVVIAFGLFFDGIAQHTQDIVIYLAPAG